MIIAIASGKGGTGKTSLAVAFAQSFPGHVQLLDCDVEEPNSSIFIKPENMVSTPVNVKIPDVDNDKCSSCGECARICQFNAIVSIGTKALVFPELCHSCGGCTLVCPENAITEIDSCIGTVESGETKRTSGKISFSEGRLSIGKAMSPPVIRAVKDKIDKKADLTILDCPPGTSCPMIEGVKGSDFIILATEPTPFGLYDLDMAVHTVRALKIPFGVVINRSDSGDDRVVKYCQKENIDLLMLIPENRKVAEAYSRGDSLLTAMPWLKSKFNEMYNKIVRQVAGRKK